VVPSLKVAREMADVFGSVIRRISHGTKKLKNWKSKVKGRTNVKICIGYNLFDVSYHNKFYVKGLDFHT
jgi:hypothetical protein